MGTISPQNHVVFLVAHGFDEAAAVSLVTQMRRAKLQVLWVGLDSEFVTGQWGTTLRPDFGFADLDTAAACPLVVLPGTPPSIDRLFAYHDVRVWLRSVLEGNYVAATTAAEAALQGVVFPDWEDHYLSQGAMTLMDYGRLLIDHVWGQTRGEAYVGDGIKLL